MQKVLITDNDRPFAISLQEGLKKHEATFTVVTAGSGVEALKVLQEMSIDLLVTAIEMTGMDGVELLAKVNQRLPQMPVIAMWDFPEPVIEARLSRYNILHFLEKPFAIESLEEAVIEGLASLRTNSVADIPTATLLQKLQREKRNCTVKVSSPEGVGYLYLQQGNLVAAECGRVKGKDAACQIICWQDREIEITKLSRRLFGPIQEPLEAVLLAAHRLKNVPKPLPEQQKEDVVAEAPKPKQQGQAVVAGKAQPKQQRQAVVAEKAQPKQQRQAVVTEKAQPKQQRQAVVAEKAQPKQQRQAVVAEKAQPKQQRQAVVADKPKPEQQRQAVVPAKPKLEQQHQAVAAEDKSQPDKARVQPHTGNTKGVQQPVTAKGPGEQIAQQLEFHAAVSEFALFDQQGFPENRGLEQSQLHGLDPAIYLHLLGALDRQLGFGSCNWICFHTGDGGSFLLFALHGYSLFIKLQEGARAQLVGGELSKKLKGMVVAP